jgi:hypothetical protein
MQKNNLFFKKGYAISCVVTRDRKIGSWIHFSNRYEKFEPLWSVARKNYKNEFKFIS